MVTPKVTNVFGPLPVGVPPIIFAFAVPLHKSPYPGTVRTGQYKSWAELASSMQSLHTAPFVGLVVYDVEAVANSQRDCEAELTYTKLLLSEKSFSQSAASTVQLGKAIV